MGKLAKFSRVVGRVLLYETLFPISTIIKPYFIIDLISGVFGFTRIRVLKLEKT